MDKVDGVDAGAVVNAVAAGIRVDAGTKGTPPIASKAMLDRRAWQTKAEVACTVAAKFTAKKRVRLEHHGSRTAAPALGSLRSIYIW